MACAGTSDLAVAGECLNTLRFFGFAPAPLADVGVAGLHRLLACRETLAGADVGIVIAGMEGALPSVVGGLVRGLLDAGRPLSRVGLEELQRHCPLFDVAVLEMLDVRHSLELRNVEGGTGPQAVAVQLEQAHRLLAHRGSPR